MVGVGRGGVTTWSMQQKLDLGADVRLFFPPSLSLNPAVSDAGEDRARAVRQPERCARTIWRGYHHGGPRGACEARVVGEGSPVGSRGCANIHLCGQCGRAVSPWPRHRVWGSSRAEVRAGEGWISPSLSACVCGGRWGGDHHQQPTAPIPSGSPQILPLIHREAASSPYTVTSWGVHLHEACGTRAARTPSGGSVVVAIRQA